MSESDQPRDLWSLRGRVALITGASSGLGARFATVLHEAGAHVVGTARRADRLDGVREQLGERFEGVSGDLTDAAFRAALAGRLAPFGRVDILVNNAGAADDGLLEEQGLEDLVRVIDLNLVSTLDLCRLCAPLLFESSGASVINVASIFGLVASRGPMAGYNATKGAIVNLTRHLAAQWGSRGVRVNTLAPGYFPSELTGFLQGEGLRAQIEGRTLLARTPSEHELDGAILFLASDASSYMTGQCLVVDGGWTAA